MLTIQLEKEEFYLDKGDGYRFYYSEPSKINMEHSLISVSKWEGIWKKPYLPVVGVDSGINSPAEELSYIACMIVGQVKEFVPEKLRTNHGTEIAEYINDIRTATTVHRPWATANTSRKTVTSELIYYWMIKFGIHHSFEKWHFNRLLTLIDVCNVMEAKGQKGASLTSVEAAKYRTDLNAKRKAGG